MTLTSPARRAPFAIVWTAALCAALGLVPAPARAETIAVIQQSYDALGRAECTAVRMNPAVFGSLPANACALGTEGTQGADRITRNVYDDAGQVTTVQRAYATPLQQNYASYTYTANGKRASVEDANGNRSTYTYDGFDRLAKLNFPSATLGAHAANPNDYESYGYDANNNRTSVRLRSGETVAFSYDALNRETLKDIPGGTANDVYSSYDAFGRKLYAHFASAGGTGVDFAYDGLGRLTAETSAGRTVASQYDSAGNRTRVTWPDGLYVDQTYDAANRMVEVRENGATSGAGLLAVYGYDLQGRRSSVTRGNGTVASYTYDGASRLASLTQDLAGTANDQSFGFAYAPSNQIVTRTVSNDAYAWSVPVVSRSYVADGLNRYASVSGTSYAYDARGNLTNDGVRRFCFDLENRLTGVAPASLDPCAAPSTLALGYDPLGRLQQTSAGATATQFLYDGDRLVAEYDGAGTLLRRYVHGAGVDEPLVWYEGAGTGDRRHLAADNQGSVIAASGAGVTRYAYGPYGEPDTWAGGRFRYTGQIALSEVSLYHYKARVYDPVLGRFLQTDPVGYQDQMNLYAYVGNDPVNQTDPSGRCPWCFVGAIIGGGVQYAVERATGSFDKRPGESQKQFEARTGQAWSRIGVAIVAGAASGGASTLITGGVAGTTVAAVGTRVVLNAAAGGAIGAAQATANANVEGRSPTSSEVVMGATVGAALSGLGSAIGETVETVGGVIAGKAASSNEAMAGRMVQHAETPGGMKIAPEPHPIATGAATFGGAVSSVHSNISPAVTPSCVPGKCGSNP